MTADVNVRCSCRKFSGLARGIDGRVGNHGKCYCDDCQLFQHFLGKADDVLDEHGGTQVFQMSPARFEVTAGDENLACLQLRPGGLCRWYASCCSTPIGNTMGNPGLPFVGVITVCLEPPPGQSLDATLGPLRFRLHGRYALGDVRAIGAHEKAPLAAILRIVGKLASWRLHGDHKRSPFFTAEGALKVDPRVLSREELRDVQRLREDWAARRQ